MFGNSIHIPNTKSIVGEEIDETDKNKYSILQLYKWTTILYQMALVYELIIVPLFWTIVFPGMVNELDVDENLEYDLNHKGENTHSIEFLIIEGVLDHTIPLIVLLIEFTINCIPFVWRHFMITVTIAIVYMVINVVWTLKKG